MTIAIRDFRPEEDADRVAEFHNRHNYGSISSGVPMRGESLLALFKEREFRLFLVAEQRNQIVGTIGYSRMSGRRVANPGELYAGFFLLSPSQRSGLLAGRLFIESYDRLINAGIRTLKVLVQPSNKKAFPLYVRMGFRSLKDMTPDEYGYVELISHMPGVTMDLVKYGQTEIDISSARSNWRMIRGSKKQSVTTGVRDVGNGIIHMDYEFDVDGQLVVATAEAETGRIVGVVLDGQLEKRFTVNDESPKSKELALLNRQVGQFCVSLSPSDGTLSISHPNHLGFLVVDAFPVTEKTPGGYRLPAVRTVRSRETNTGWVSTDGEVTRAVDFTEDSVTVTVAGPSGSTLIAYPWSGFRTAEFSLAIAGSRPEGGHCVVGLWPSDIPNFETAADDRFTVPAHGSQATWGDYTKGIELIIDALTPGRWRVEGQHAARIAGEGNVSYRYTPQETLRDRGTLFAPQPQVDTEVGDWAPIRLGGQHVLQLRDWSSFSRLVVSPECGLIEWTHDGEEVISSTFPRDRGAGALGTVTTSMWAATQTDRTSISQGVEWASHDALMSFADRAPSHWDIRPTPGFGSLVVDVQASNDSGQARELSLNLLSPNRPQFVDIETSTGNWQRVAAGSISWRTWTRTARLPVGTGYILIAPVSGHDPEIFIRSHRFGMLFTMLARIDQGTVGHARWCLSHLPEEKAGEGEFETVVEGA